MPTLWNRTYQSVSQTRSARSSISSWTVRICTILVVLGLMSSAGSAALINLKISGDLPGYSNVIEKWALSPNGQVVVFITDKETDNKYELYSVKLDGSSPVKISGTLSADEDVSDFIIAQDNTHVVFATTLSGSINNTELLSTPIAGGEAPIPLNGALPACGYIHGFQVSNNGLQVAYDVKSSCAYVEALYTTPIHGGEPALIHLIPQNEWSHVFEYAITPDSSKIVYIYEDASTGPSSSTISFQPIAGSAETVMGNDYGINFLISPDSRGIAYNGASGYFFFKNFDASSPTLIPPLNVEFRDDDFAFIPNSQTILFTREVSSSEVLGAISRDGGEPVYLSGETIAGGNVISFQITNDSKYVIYLADQRYDEAIELYGVPVDGSTSPFLISQLPATNRDVIDYAISPNSQSVVYIADQAAAGDEKYELYAWTNGTTIKLNDAITPIQGDVTDFAISNNSMGVVYLADQEVDERFELYAWIWGAREKLNLTLANNRDVKEFLITPNNQAAIYRADQDVWSKNELYMTTANFGYSVYLPVVVK